MHATIKPHAQPIAESSFDELVPVSLDDRDLFDKAFSARDERISDASFAASVCWAAPLDLRRVVIEDHLCLFSAADGDLSMMLPPLTMGDPARLADALSACFELMDAANRDGPGVERSRIEYVGDDDLQRIQQIDPIGLSAGAMPGDYIYCRDDLVELAGGPLKNKRKLRHRFLRDYPDAVTADLTEDDVPECLALLTDWRDDADERHEGVANDQLVGLDELRRRDVACTRRYLELFRELDLRTMTLRSEGQLLGFTLGEVSTPRMGVVAVEKTLPGAVGAPQFIYSEFCRTRFEGCDEINAGDDWDIPTLRFTKLSYRPVRMLSKNVLTRAESPNQGVAPTVRKLRARRAGPHTAAEPTPAGASVRLATPADEAAIIAVERAAFAADDTFTTRQVHRLLANPRARVGVAEIDGSVVGWCVALIRKHVKSKSGRVYSVAVAPQAAGRGAGKLLVAWALDTLATDGITRVYLEVRQNNERAIGLYKTFGFEPIRVLPGYYGKDDGLRMRRVARTQ